MSSVEFSTLLIVIADFLKPFAFNLTHDEEHTKNLYQEPSLKHLTTRKNTWQQQGIRAIMRNTFINSCRKK